MFVGKWMSYIGVLRHGQTFGPPTNAPPLSRSVTKLKDDPWAVA